MYPDLYEKHKELNAKFITFCGYEMPLYYRSVLEEHRSVRESCGLFDLSHMGRISLKGMREREFLDKSITNYLPHLDGHSCYTPLLNQEGKVIDDILLYREKENSYFLIVNAANKQKVFNYLLECGLDSKQPSEEGILALQGPKSSSLIKKIYPQAAHLAVKCFLKIEGITLSRTGYTGEDGFEFFASNERIRFLWEKMVELGATPCGLGARDTLRLEMGYALYGHELSESIAPNESVAYWTVKWDKNFFGKQALLNLENSSYKRHAYGIFLEEKVAREGCRVFKEDQLIGLVTSGNFSPSLKRGIGLILSNQKLLENEKILVEIREKKVNAIVSSLPFFRRKI